MNINPPPRSPTNLQEKITRWLMSYRVHQICDTSTDKAF